MRRFSPFRIVLALVGGAAIAWGSLVLPIFWGEGSGIRVASRIVDGERFSTGVLTGLASAMDAPERDRCRPAITRAKALVQLRILEDLLAAGARQQIDAQTQQLYTAIRYSLACAPADAFLWMVLMWAESLRDGYHPNQLTYLRMSYSLSINEAWVGLKRNRLAIALLERLPPDLADMAIAEFASLLNNGFHRETIATLVGPGWSVRDKLLPELDKVSEHHKRVFAQTLFTYGYDVAVPGVQLPERRPWR
jgi:hypothetical protein